jgi:hypothetical protein
MISSARERGPPTSLSNPLVPAAFLFNNGFDASWIDWGRLDFDEH